MQTDSSNVMGRVGDIIIKKQYIYAVDRSQQIVFIFDKSGQFVSTLDKTVKAIAVDEDKRIIYAITCGFDTEANIVTFSF